MNLAWGDQGDLLHSRLLNDEAGDTQDITDLPAIEVQGLGLRFVNAPYLLKPDVSFDLKSLRIELAPDLL